MPRGRGGARGDRGFQQQAGGEGGVKKGTESGDSSVTVSRVHSNSPRITAMHSRFPLVAEPSMISLMLIKVGFCDLCAKH